MGILLKYAGKILRFNMKFKGKSFQNHLYPGVILNQQVYI